MRVPLLTSICLFFACAAYASAVHSPSHNHTISERTFIPLKAIPEVPPQELSTGGTTSDGGCAKGLIQRIWDSRGAYIGPTGSGTKGVLYYVNGGMDGHPILIKKISKFSVGETVFRRRATIEAAVKREVYHLKLLGQLAIDGYGFYEGCYYIVMWKMGDTAYQTKLSAAALKVLKDRAREREGSKTGLYFEMVDRNFLFFRDRSGRYTAAFPVELSDAYDKDGVMLAVPNGISIQVEKFRGPGECAVKRDG